MMNKPTVVLFAALQLMVVQALAAKVDAVTLDGEAYVCPSEDTTISNLTVTTGSAGNTLTVPAGVTLTVNGCRGGGALEKLGPGKMIVCDVDPAAQIVVTAGELFFGKSQGVASLATAASLHLDAAQTESFAFENNDGVNVSGWYDVRDAKDAPTHPYPYAYFSWGKNPCRYADNQTGQGIVDFFSATDGWTPCMLMMSNDDGAASSFSYGAGPGVTKIREIFMVVKDQPNTNLEGRKYQSFLCDYDAPGNYNYWFCRGNGGEIWSSDYNETAGLRSGSTWVDGAAVSGTSVFPQGGFHLLRAKRSNDGRFSALSYDHQNGDKAAGQGGGLAIGELIVFRADGQPGDDAAAEITSRLTHKWFGRQSLVSLRVSESAKVTASSGETVSFGNCLSVTESGVRCVIRANETCVISASTSLSLVEVVGDNATLEVAEGVTVTVGSLTGAGTLVKAGAGTVEVKDVGPTTRVAAQGGLVRFARSSGVEALAGAAALHLDASKEGTVVTGTSGVEKWYDVRGQESYPQAGYLWGGYPQFRTNAQNGLPTVDFLQAKNAATTAGMLYIQNLQGDDATGNWGYNSGPGIKSVREFFMVVKDKPDATLGGRKYQSLLCDSDSVNNYNFRFCRGTDGEIWHGAYNETASLRNAGAWIDGTWVDWQTVVPQDALHVVRSIRSDDGRFSSLCYDHDKITGGLEIGELIVFKKDSQPTNADAAEITRRLMHKWNGRQALEAVSIGTNGKVEIASGESLQPSALTLARLDAVAGEMPLQPTDLTIAESGTVVLTLPAGYKAMGGRAIPLVTATGTVTGADNLSNWSVVCDWKYGVKLAVVDKTLCAVPNPPGLVIVVR